MSLISNINKSLILNFHIGKYNVILSGLLSFVFHPVYWVLWTYVSPGYYDSFILRFSCSFLGLFLLFYKKWPKFLKKIIYIYWYLFIIFILPMTFTYLGLKNNFTEVWTMCYVMAFFFVILFSYNIIIPISQILLGGILGYGLFIIEGNQFNISQINIESFIVFVFIFCAGVLFSYFGRLGVNSFFNENKENRKKRKELLESLSASIAHELKNPLAAIKMQIVNTRNIMQKLHISNEIKKAQTECFVFIQNCIVRASDIINITLNELRGKKITKEDLTYIDAKFTLKQAINEYGYDNYNDKNKIKFNYTNNFIFSGNKASFIYIIFNLIRNSLYYSLQKDDFQITISMDQKGAYNIISFEDNGPGVRESRIGEIFNSFYTYGKKGGTGLGLPFCKRVMESIGGSINCESEFGKWARFNLLFPKLDNEIIIEAKKEIALRHKNESASIFLKTKKAKILLVDDYAANVKPLQSKIEVYFPHFICVIETDSQKVPEIIKHDNYDLILMDLDMPKMDGFECTKEIRKINKEIPILAHTSHKTHDMAEKAIKSGMNGFMTKPCDNLVMLRNISKWCFNEFSPLGIISKQYFKKLLSDKHIVIVDDQQLNLKITSEFLKEHGVNVSSFYNPHQALEFIIRNYENLDLILTDMNMPHMCGDDLVKKIRKMEDNNNQQAYLPVIALTGAEDNNYILDIFRSGFDDFIVKGADLDYMIEIITLWSHVYLDQTRYDLRSSEAILSTDNINQKIENKYKHNSKKTYNINNKKSEDMVIFNKEKLGFLKKADIKEIIASFKTDSNNIFKSIQAAAEINDIETLFKETHALKGISGSMGFELLYSYVCEINNIFRDSKLPDKNNWVENLEKLLKQSFVAANSFKDK